MDTSMLIKLDTATRMLAEIVTVDDAVKLMDLAEAARIYAKQVKLGTEAQNHAAEIKIRAQRKAGEILDQIEGGQGLRTDLTSVQPEQKLKTEVYKDLNINNRDAHQWQKIGTMPKGDFESYITTTKNDDRELTTAGIYREAIRSTAADKPPAPVLPDNKYSVIYADPPWKYETFGVSVSEFYGGSERHYPVMDIAELEALPIKEIALPDAVLFLWVTSPKLNQVWSIIQAWGFEYKTSFIWDKVKHNFGYYNSVRHELLLICGRGSSTPEVKQLFDSVQTIERTSEHSEKPDEFRKIIETLYPSGKKIELFARRKFPGWDTWGNEPC